LVDWWGWYPNLPIPNLPLPMFTRIRLYYLLTQAAFGICLPFINVYFEHERGLSGREIGILAAVAPLMSLLIAPVWGTAADARGSRLRVLRWAMAGAAGGALLLGLPDLFWPLLLTMGLFTFFQVAIIPLGDGVITAAAAEQKVSYGSLRLWGSIGFALGGLLFGQIGRWLGLRAMFPAYALLMLLALPVMWRMVSHEPPPTGKRGRTLVLLRDRPLALFLFVAGLAATGITAGYMFLHVFLGTLGANTELMGMVSAVGAMAEVPFMLWGGRLIQKRGAPLVFAAGMALFAIGWGLYALLQVPGLALLIQLVNGAAMGLLWPAGVVYVAQRAPAGQTATAQSLLGAVMYGMAPLVATQLAGGIFDAAGARTVLGGAAGTMVIGILLFALTRRWVD